MGSADECGDGGVARLVLSAMAIKTTSFPSSIQLAVHRAHDSRGEVGPTVMALDPVSLTEVLDCIVVVDEMET